MAIHVQCDYCGQTIGQDDRLIMLEAGGRGVDTGGSGIYVNECMGYYHGDLQADGVSCYRRMRDAVRDLHATQERERDCRVTPFLEQPPVEQEHQILNALGDGRLRPREAAKKIQATDDWVVSTGAVQRIMDKMTARGDLERVKEPRKPGSKQHWWTYSRVRVVSPELEALERALKTEEA
jgi:hypothetical protein